MIEPPAFTTEKSPLSCSLCIKDQFGRTVAVLSWGGSTEGEEAARRIQMLFSGEYELRKAPPVAEPPQRLAR